MTTNFTKKTDEKRCGWRGQVKRLESDYGENTKVTLTFNNCIIQKSEE